MSAYTDAVAEADTWIMDARYREGLKRLERLTREIDRMRRRLDQRPVDYLALGFFNRKELT